MTNVNYKLRVYLGLGRVLRNLNVKNCQNFPVTDRPTDKPTPRSSDQELKDIIKHFHNRVKF